MDEWIYVVANPPSGEVEYKGRHCVFKRPEELGEFDLDAETLFLLVIEDIIPKDTVFVLRFDEDSDKVRVLQASVEYAKEARAYEKKLEERWGSNWRESEEVRDYIKEKNKNFYEMLWLTVVIEKEDELRLFRMMKEWGDYCNMVQGKRPLKYVIADELLNK